MLAHQSKNIKPPLFCRACTRRAIPPLGRGRRAGCKTTPSDRCGRRNHSQQSFYTANFQKHLTQNKPSLRNDLFHKDGLLILGIKLSAIAPRGFRTSCRDMRQHRGGLGTSPQRQDDPRDKSHRTICSLCQALGKWLDLFE